MLYSVVWTRGLNSLWNIRKQSYRKKRYQNVLRKPYNRSFLSYHCTPTTCVSQYVANAGKHSRKHNTSNVLLSLYVLNKIDKSLMKFCVLIPGFYRSLYFMVLYHSQKSKPIVSKEIIHVSMMFTFNLVVQKYYDIAWKWNRTLLICE